ncbi:class I SAM-dependent methyltransferase [Fulvivirga lutimaris]|uniref:class I SAM-dependent methyltransferase n=1 Tax=Fulvivirga lutimaris TaxID=1819566 RepID=UPI0012BB996A|nr:class I SAM-dependent methyltransferase [Fulvivirga lutimaris]MTI39489.1 class I SAM-dependent methyltransferase [Fulvivirga lutimaris]
MKDNFSGHAAYYARFRPAYPEALYNFILANTEGRELAWDCATGNGQVASELSKHYNRVQATDLSERQIDNAIEKGNVDYSVQVAEQTSFDDNSIDLITVGQAYHWFDFEKFHNEAKRVLKPDGTIALFGYGLHEVDDKVNELMNHFYHDIVGPYWDDERKYIDEQYKNTPFPYHEIVSPEFEFTAKWSVDHYIGYIKTWSAVKHFEKAKGFDPVDDLEKEIRKYWNEKLKLIKFPIFLRLGKV